MKKKNFVVIILASVLSMHKKLLHIVRYEMKNEK